MPTTYEALDKAYIRRGLRIMELEAERDQLRDALIETANALGGEATAEVSTRFLCEVPKEAAKARAAKQEIEDNYWKVVTDLHAEQEKNDRWIASNQSQGRELAKLRTDLEAERIKIRDTAAVLGVDLANETLPDGARRLRAENEYNISAYEKRIADYSDTLQRVRAELQHEKDQRRELHTKLADGEPNPLAPYPAHGG